MIEALEKLYEFGSSLLSIDRQQKFLDKRKQYTQDYYNREMDNATNLFNRQYYGSYLDTPSAQKMLKQVRENLGEQARTMRNTASVMGLTGESYAAMQKNNNKVLDSMVGTLAAQDTQRKDRALQGYENVRSRMENLMYNTNVDDSAKRLMLEEQRSQTLHNFMLPMFPKLASILSELNDNPNYPMPIKRL